MTNEITKAPRETRVLRYRIPQRLYVYITGTGAWGGLEKRDLGDELLIAAIKTADPCRGRGVAIDLCLESARALYRHADYLQSAAEGGWGDPDAYADKRVAIRVKEELLATWRS